VTVELGDLPSARACLEQSLTLRNEMRMSGQVLHFGSGLLWDIPQSLAAFGYLAAKGRQWKRSATLFAAATARREQFEIASPSVERERQEQEESAARESLGDEAFASAQAGGRAMTIEQAVAYALATE
jgi:hypothetical protein